MKVKTSITLSERALREVDRLAGKNSSRSAVIERAILEFVEQQGRAARGARDRKLIDQHADALNRDARDVLDFQALP